MLISYAGYLSPTTTSKMTSEMTYETTSFPIPISDVLSEVALRPILRLAIRLFRNFPYVLFDVWNDVIFYVRFLKRALNFLLLALILVCYCDTDRNAEWWSTNTEAEFTNLSCGIYCETFTTIRTCIAENSWRREVHIPLVTKIYVNYLLSAHQCSMNRKSEYKFSV